MLNIKKMLIKLLDLTKYYTTDQAVGIWTDGKTVYRRVVKGNTNVTTDTWKQVATITGVDSVVKLTGYLLQNGNTYAGSFANFALNPTTGNLSIRFPQTTAITYVLILEYTKA